MPKFTTFRQQDVFPLIARLILQVAAGSPDYVYHERIVAALLSDQEGIVVVSNARQTSKLDTEERVASNMVQWFSQRITVGRNAFSVLFDREKVAKRWAYRVRRDGPVPIVEEMEFSAIEGEPRLFFHFRRERNPELRKAKRDQELELRGRLSCEACGHATDQLFPGLMEDILEVHHRRPLSDVESSVSTNLCDLALLCPNCHRAIHKTKPYLSVEEFHQKFF